MSAIILAAGRGSRMKQATEEVPKCLVRLLGKELLEWQLSALQKNGLRKILLIGGYKKERLLSKELEIIENCRWHSTNIVRSLLCASERMSSETNIISYADIAYHPHIIEALLKVDGDIVISYDRDWLSLWQARFEDPLIDAETFKSANGKLRTIGEKASSIQEIEGQYMGLLKISPKGFLQIKQSLSSLTDRELDKLDMTSLLQVLLKKNIEIQTVPISGKWVEVDSPLDLAIYEERTKIGQWSHDWRDL